ncbi:MAG: hypothetical protein LBD94_00610 [Rickettsiales bacterium]|jgi:hypothetical protein|nr:hypothetical protein [Rickettsiales bacterium]
MAEGINDFVPFVSLGERGGTVSFENFDIDGIKLRAAYDASHRLLFVLDLTKDNILPNILLVVGDRDGRKWDDILQNDFGVNPESVRPRVNNKYQKLDIDYECINYYNDAITTGGADTLRPVRIGIAERQRNFRIGEAYHEIELARATVSEATKTISDLDEFIKSQKGKLKAAKKNVGKEPPKDSAAKILRYESRIDRAIAKKARATRRMKRAEKRIDSSTKMLNNYKDIIMPRGQEMDENDVKPLFTEDPKIIDTDGAFKPVSFDAEPQPTPAPSVPPAQSAPYVSSMQAGPARPPIMRTVAPSPPKRPVAPISGEIKISSEAHTGRQGGAYYLMLTLLIGLSVFTLYLYQKKMGASETPHIAATQPDIINPIEPEPAESAESAEQISGPTPVEVATLPEMPEPAAETIPDFISESELESAENLFIESPSVAPTSAGQPVAVAEQPVGPELETQEDILDGFATSPEPEIENLPLGPEPESADIVGENETMELEQPFDESGGSMPIEEPNVLDYEPNDGVFETEPLPSDFEE